MSTKNTLITIVVVLVIVFAVWYLSSIFIKNSQQGTSNNLDTTANISLDLQQIPDDTSPNNEMNSFDKEVQNF